MKISCKYCGRAMERRNLKSHTTRVHVGFTPAERPSTNQGILSFPIRTIKNLCQAITMVSYKKARMEDGNDIQGEEKANDEMSIAFNGPEICVKKNLDDHLKYSREKNLIYIDTYYVSC